MSTNIGTAGIETSVAVRPRNIFWDGQGKEWFSNYGEIINGNDSRDYGNTNNLYVLRAGLLMSKHKNGDDNWRPTIMGTLTADLDSGGSSFTIATAEGTEIVRRYGAAAPEDIFLVNAIPDDSSQSTFTIVAESINYSAISAGTVTCSAVGDSYPAGSLVISSESVLNASGLVDNLLLTPTTILHEETGIRVVDDNLDGQDVPLGRILMGGHIDTSKILAYPTIPGLQRWLKSQIAQTSPNVVFKDDIV